MKTLRYVYPVLYKPGTVLSSDGVSFDHFDMIDHIGREIVIPEGLQREKVVHFSPKEITEFHSLIFNGRTYTVGIKSYVLPDDGNTQVFTFLLSQTIGMLLEDARMSECNGASSVYMRDLERYVRMEIGGHNSDQGNNYIRAYMDIILLNKISQNLLHTTRDLLLAQSKGDSLVSQNPIAAIDGIINAITLPVKSVYENSSSVMSRILEEMSAFNPSIQRLEDLKKTSVRDETPYYQFKCPVNRCIIDREVNADYRFMKVLCLINKCIMNNFCIKYTAGNRSMEMVYGMNTYLNHRYCKVPKIFTDIFESLARIYNDRFSAITICKTITEECFIKVERQDGTVDYNYIDMTVALLLSQELVTD